MLPQLHDGKTLEDLKNEVEETFSGIPFGNSKFQIENFVLNAAITPERRFKTIGLELKTRLEEVERIKYKIRRLDIDIEEMQYKIQKETDTFAKRRFEIDLEMKMVEIENTKKSIKDYIREIEIYYHHFKSAPPITREQFEKSEEDYYKIHLRNQVIGMEGAHLSLYSMGYGIGEKGELLELRKIIERE